MQGLLEEEDADCRGCHNRQSRPDGIGHRHAIRIHSGSQHIPNCSVEEDTQRKEGRTVHALLEAGHRQGFQHDDEQHVPINPGDTHLLVGRVLLNMDSIVRAVIAKFEVRAKIGKEKYGTDLDRTDLSVLDWIQHAQEEHMDAILYLEKLKQTLAGKK